MAAVPFGQVYPGSTRSGSIFKDPARVQSAGPMMMVR
jgi:hypothetical protein